MGFSLWRVLCFTVDVDDGIVERGFRHDFRRRCGNAGYRGCFGGRALCGKRFVGSFADRSTHQQVVFEARQRCILRTGAVHWGELQHRGNMVRR